MSNFQIQPRIAQYRRRYEPAESSHTANKQAHSACFTPIARRLRQNNLKQKHPIFNGQESNSDVGYLSVMDDTEVVPPKKKISIFIGFWRVGLPVCVQRTGRHPDHN